jgi:glucose-1-phosphate adenylyltransferase
MQRVIALILGGGQGRRLFPLTKYRSKPAVPIGGKYRLIDIPISNCLHSGIKDIYVVTQFNSESLNNHINNTYRFDYFSRAFVRILAAEQTMENTNWYQGTADAVRKNILHLNFHNIDLVLVLSGDHLYRMDYRHLVDFHRQRKADFTVSVIPIKASETREFGILKLRTDDRIVDFKEKPSTASELRPLRFMRKVPCPNGPLPHPAYLASMGVYLFRVDILADVLKSKDADFGREIIPHSIDRYKTFGYVFNGYWKDIGTIKSFYDVNIDFTSKRPHFSFFSEDRVFTRPRFLPPAQISNAKIKNCLIAEGCVIKGSELEHSVVGLRTIIGDRCRISKTVIMGADYYDNPNSAEDVKTGIGDGCLIERAIIDKNARIGAGTVIRNLRNLDNFDGENYYIRDKIVIIPKDATIPPHAKI